MARIERQANCATGLETPGRAVRRCRCLVAAVVLASVAGWFSRSVAEQEAVDQAQTTNELLARAVVAASTDRRACSPRAPPTSIGSTASCGRESSAVRCSASRSGTSDGEIVYSDEPRLIGDQFALGDEEREVLEIGRSVTLELSDSDERENRYEQPSGASPRGLHPGQGTRW